MEASLTPLVVLAKGKISECVERANSQGLSQGRQVAILGRGPSINKAISVAEIVKRLHTVEEGGPSTLVQETRIYTQTFESKPQSCIEIKLAPSS